jgi:predicted dehydrogenase
MKKINFGIIGTGRMASNMLDTMRHQSQINVHAVFGNSIERTEIFCENHNITNAYDDLDALLENAAIDAVYIASSNEKHTSQVLSALRAGKAVLCEKPIAISTEEIVLIEKVAAESNLLCMEAMWTLFLPSYQRFFEIKEQQTYGIPMSLYADFGYPTSEKSDPKLFSLNAGGGVLLDRAVYPIALAIKVFGSVTAIHANVTYSETGVDTDASILLKHSGGGMAQLAVSANALLQNRAVLSLTKGNVSLEAPLLGSEVVISQKFDIHEQATDSPKNLKIIIKNKLKKSSTLRKIKSLKTHGHKEYMTYGANQYLPMLNHFCKLMDNSKFESNVVPLSLSNEVIAVIDQIKKAKEQH